MRETKTIELPVSKIKAEIVTYLTYGEFKKIETATFAAAKGLRQEGGQTFTEVDGAAMGEASKIAMLCAVQKFTDPNGVEIPVTWETICELRSEDGRVLQSAVDSIDDDMRKK